MKVLLNSFHLNGRILGFHPQSKKYKDNFVQRNTHCSMKRRLDCFNSEH